MRALWPALEDEHADSRGRAPDAGRRSAAPAHRRLRADRRWAYRRARHRGGSIDWCCLKRLDAGSVFGRLLDSQRGGHFALAPSAPRAEAERGYLDGSLVLCTTWRTATGRARVLDFLAVCREAPGRARRQLVRIVEGLAGEV